MEYMAKYNKSYNTHAEIKMRAKLY